MTGKLNWGILGTGVIAKAFAQHLPRSRTGKLLAVGSRDKAKGETFAREHGVAVGYGSYEEVLADPNVQAVYIATPHPLHYELTLKACAAGKHVLCEKPLGVNTGETMMMIEAARAHDIFLMEAFMYLCTPQTRKLIEIIRSGALGQVRVIQATFSFHWPPTVEQRTRLTDSELAGGGILDVGCYPISFARLVAGVANGTEFAEPVALKGAGHVGKTGIDEWASAVLRFPGDIVAHLSTGVQVNQESACRVYGSEGWMHLPSPWVPAREGGTTQILLHRKGQANPETIEVESPEPLYAIEADWVAANLEHRQAAWPGMSWEASLANMRALDAWRKEINLRYPFEKPGAIRTFASDKPATTKMKYAKIAGIDKPVARLVMGCDNQPNLPHAAAVFDDYVSAGGNTFDTAYVYGGNGVHERLFGQWLLSRNNRNEIVLIAKGAHTPYCFPNLISVQLNESLERMNTDYADLYLLHRDNPNVPVGEFVDALNQLLRAGRFRAFGGSNWSVERVQAANQYARKNGLQGFSAISNNFSLARLIEPMWAGCLSASDAQSRAFFEQTQLPLLAWSSQARGFFLPGRAAPGKLDDKELVRCWYSPDNFQRLERVNELASRRGVLPINIALAYVLHQKFPTFALIGPRTVHETHTSLPALDVELSLEELQWLNLEK